MTKKERLQNQMIDLLVDQVQQLSLMSKIELGDDVLEEIQSLKQEINSCNSVSFVDEVEEFNNLMGKSWQNRKTPQINEKDAKFVVDFIDEELNEMKQAIKDKDIVGILDAILDITYVCLGNGALVFGLKDKITDGYAEVQASNMSKICKTEEEAIETVKIRSEQQGEPCHYEKIGDGYVVYRTRDLKVQKSISYKAPNLKQFFTQEEIESCKNE